MKFGINYTTENIRETSSHVQAFKLVSCQISFFYNHGLIVFAEVNPAAGSPQPPPMEPRRTPHRRIWIPEAGFARSRPRRPRRTTPAVAGEVCRRLCRHAPR